MKSGWCLFYVFAGYLCGLYCAGSGLWYCNGASGTAYETFCLVTGVNQRRLFGRGDYRGAILDLLSFFWINVSAFIICTLCALIVLFILPADAPHEVSSTSAVHSKDKKRTPTGINNGVIVGLLTVLGLLLMSRMITQTPFSLYVSTVFNAPNWLTGLAYGLQATGVIVSASLWARLFEAHDIASTLYRMVGVIMGCILVTLLLATVRGNPLVYRALFL